MRVDITSHSNFEAAFEKCFELYGGIDVMVNNAGVDGEINWETQLQINFYVSLTIVNTIWPLQPAATDDFIRLAYYIGNHTRLQIGA